MILGGRNHAKEMISRSSSRKGATFSNYNQSSLFLRICWRHLKKPIGSLRHFYFCLAIISRYLAGLQAWIPIDYNCTVLLIIVLLVDHVHIFYPGSIGRVVSPTPPTLTVGNSLFYTGYLGGENASPDPRAKLLRPDQKVLGIVTVKDKGAH